MSYPPYPSNFPPVPFPPNPNSNAVNLEFTVNAYKGGQVTVPVSSTLNNRGSMVRQQINVTGPIQALAGDSDGLGVVFTEKITSLDQAGNTYANWVSTFNFNGTNSVPAGTIEARIPLLNNTAWDNKANPSSNPSELVLPTGATSQDYMGIITGGNGPFSGATGTVVKTKSNISDYRPYKFYVTLPNGDPNGVFGLFAARAVKDASAMQVNITSVATC